MVEHVSQGNIRQPFPYTTTPLPHFGSAGSGAAGPGGSAGSEGAAGPGGAEGGDVIVRPLGTTSPGDLNRSAAT